jgi:hypothetical protein
MTPSEQESVAETVKANAAADAEANGITNLNVEVLALAADCSRRRLTGDKNLDTSLHRRLPSGSSAVEFSMVITGAFRPNEMPSSGEGSAIGPDSIDLGGLAEDSINRDKEKFIRDLADRAPAGSSLTEVQSLEVQAIEAPPEGVTVPFTKPPTQQTSPPPQIVVLDDNNDNKAGFYISAVIILGMIVFLSSFLLFRLASRYEMRKRNLYMKEVHKEKELHRQDRRVSLARWAAARRFSLGSSGVAPIHTARSHRSKHQPVQSHRHIDQSNRTGTTIFSDSQQSTNVHVDPLFQTSDDDLSIPSYEMQMMPGDVSSYVHMNGVSSFRALSHDYQTETEFERVKSSRITRE